MPGNRLTLIAAAAAVVAAGCAGTGPGSSRPPPGAASRPLVTFLTVATAGPVIRGNYLIRYGTSALQLRSARGGQVVATLLRSLASLDAVLAPDGSVVAAEDFGCRTRLLRIEPRTGRARLIRTLPESAGGIALSPDGRRLAYLTYPASDPQPCGPARQPAAPVRVFTQDGGVARFLPSVLAVVTLASGTVVRAATRNPGNPPFDPAWSPDGASVAVIYSWSVAVLSSGHPDFAAARLIRPARHCGYSAVTWTTAGLLAARGCARTPAPAPTELVALPAARGHDWPLPPCTAGVGLLVDPTLRHVLVESGIGFGTGPPCGLSYERWSAKIAELRPGRLATIAVLGRPGGDQSQLTGW